MFGLIGAYYRREANFSFGVNTFVKILICLRRNMSTSIYR